MLLANCIEKLNKYMFMNKNIYGSKMFHGYKKKCFCYFNVLSI